MNHSFHSSSQEFLELPSELQTQVTPFFPFVQPLLLTFLFHTPPLSPVSYQFTSSVVSFPPAHPHISLPPSLEKGPGGDADLWFEPHFPACCGRKVCSHGIAISPAKRYASRQLPAAAGSLIRVFVMNPNLTCHRCHTALEGGRLIMDWGYASEAAISLINKNLYALIEPFSICVLVCNCILHQPSAMVEILSQAKKLFICCNFRSRTVSTTLLGFNIFRREYILGSQYVGSLSK